MLLKRKKIKSGVFWGREKGEERVYGQEENGVFVKKRNKNTEGWLIFGEMGVCGCQIFPAAAVRCCLWCSGVMLAGAKEGQIQPNSSASRWGASGGEKMQEKDKNWDKCDLLSSRPGRKGLREAVECCKPRQGCTIFSSA